MKPDYPIIYEGSFLLFWGAGLSISLFLGGALGLLCMLISLLMLITHEHAHLKECMRTNTKIKSMTFSWMGGAAEVDSEFWNMKSILLAGVYDTWTYFSVFTGVLFIVWYWKDNLSVGINFANNPWLNLITSLSMMSGVFFFTNILPITIHTKKYGPISTDGWAAVKLTTLQREMWNEGKHLALQVDEGKIPDIC
jgi:hypothetical protein